MGALIDLFNKFMGLFTATYNFFLGIMSTKKPPQVKKFTYIFHIRVETDDDVDFYIAKKITEEPYLRIPDIVGILKNPVSFKKSDPHTFLASVLVDTEEAPQLLQVLTHMGFFLDGTIKASELHHD